MAHIEYACRTFRGSLIRESDAGSQWVYRLSGNQTPPSSALEDEIYQLRLRMEQMFDREQCLTAPNVVEISTMLDLKINEYMLRRA